MTSSAGTYCPADATLEQEPAVEAASSRGEIVADEDDQLAVLHLERDARGVQHPQVIGEARSQGCPQWVKAAKLITRAP